VTDPDDRITRGPVGRGLRAVAVQTALVSAAVHLLWALPRLASPADARPYLFVVAGAFTLAVAVGVFRADEYRRLHALGAGTFATFLGGYLLFHRGGVVAALVSDPLAAVGKAAELLGLVAFVGLYRRTPPTHVVLERTGESARGEE